MSHHEVLEATANGKTVILCDHSNTERGFNNRVSTIFCIMIFKCRFPS